MDTSKPSRRTTVATTKRTFLANAAHELRTPLHSAGGFVEMVLDGFAGPLSERQSEMLSYSRTAIGQLGILLEEVLFLARVDSGELVPRLSTVDPAAVLHRAIDIVREQASEKNVTITPAEWGMLPTIQADSERMREGLIGLLRGGLALAPANGTITIEAKSLDKRLVVRMLLHQVRLSAADLRCLFDRFYQPRPIGADRSAHPGLGLAIARVTAEWHGGATYTEAGPDDCVILCYEAALGGI